MGEHQPVCDLHRQQHAVGRCTACGRMICQDCMKASPDAGTCPECGELGLRQARAKARAKIAFGALVVLLVAGAALALWMSGAGTTSRPTPSPVAPFDYRHHSDAVTRLRRQLEADACNKRFGLDLGNKLNEAGDFAGAAAFVTDFVKRCGTWPRLLWVSMHSYQQRGMWKEAVDVATQLIKARPDDSDYWWWRGEAFAELGGYAQAASDYYQSMASLPNGFASGRLAQWVKDKLGRPCDGAFALQYWLEQRPQEAEAWAPARRSELFLAGNCAKRAGVGRAVVRFPKKAAVVRTSGALNRLPTEVILSATSGYTVVRRELAEAAKITPTGDPIQIYVAGEIREARLGTAKRLSVGQAHVDELPVAIVDGLPENVSVVAGVNFLWHFSVTRDERSLVLSSHGTTL